MPFSLLQHRDLSSGLFLSWDLRGDPCFLSTEAIKEATIRQLAVGARRLFDVNL